MSYTNHHIVVKKGRKEKTAGIKDAITETERRELHGNLASDL